MIWARIDTSSAETGSPEILSSLPGYGPDIAKNRALAPAFL
jgi:hypothetical protein